MLIIKLAALVGVGNESFVLIGYPSRQDGPILPAQDCPHLSRASKKNSRSGPLKFLTFGQCQCLNPQKQQKTVKTKKT